MIDTLAPGIAAGVSEADYARLLGMRGRPLEGAVAERAAWAREWYARNGRPFVAARRHAIASQGAVEVLLGSPPTCVEFRSRALSDHLRRWEAHAVLGLAASAGPEVDEACSEMWRDGRPDEAYFLERFAVAVVERLVFATRLGECRSAEGNHETLTPHLSPGCGSWRLEDQHRLWSAIFPGSDDKAGMGPMRLLESGGLHPKCSVLAAMGITRRHVAASAHDSCRACDLACCAFRRAPFKDIARQREDATTSSEVTA